MDLKFYIYQILGVGVIWAGMAFFSLTKWVNQVNLFFLCCDILVIISYCFIW